MNHAVFIGGEFDKCTDFDNTNYFSFVNFADEIVVRAGVFALADDKMNKARQCVAACFRPVRIRAAFGFFNQNVHHGIDVHVARGTERRQTRKRQRIPAGVINAFFGFVFRAPVDDENGADGLTVAAGFKAQFGLRVVHDDADIVRFKNGRHNHAHGFTRAGRRQDQYRQCFGQLQQFTAPASQNDDKARKQPHFFDVFFGCDSPCAVNGGHPRMRVGQQPRRQNADKGKKR